MDSILKKLDDKLHVILSDPQLSEECKHNSKLRQLKESENAFTVGDLIIALNVCASKQFSAQKIYQLGILELLFDLCYYTPISESEMEFYDMFQPLWSLIENLLKYRDLLNSLYDIHSSPIRTCLQNMMQWFVVMRIDQKKEKLRILQKTLKSIARLSVNTSFAKEFVETQYIDQIQEINRRMIDNQKVVLVCLKIYINVAKHQSLKVNLIKQEILANVNNIYKIFNENIKIQFYSADLTYSLALEQSSHSKRVDLMSILNTQIMGLKKFMLNDQIVERNIHSLAALMFNNLQLQQMFLHQNPIDLLIKFSSDYKDSPKICTGVSLIINSLAYKNNQLKDILGQQGLVTVLMSIYINFTQQDNYNFFTVKSCLKAICNVCVNQTNANLLMNLQFIKHTKNLLHNRYMVGDESEVDFYCSIILDLIYYICNPQRCAICILDIIIDEGLIELLLQCLKLNRRNPDLVYKGLDTLGPFLSVPQSIQKFTDSDGFGVICNVIQSTQSDFYILQECFEILIEVLSNDSGKIDLLMGYKIHLDMVNILKQLTLQELFNKISLNLFDLILGLCHLLSSDSVKCRMIYNSQFLEFAFQIFQQADFSLRKDIVDIFLLILLTYSQIQEACVLIAAYGSSYLIQVLKDHINNYQIIEDISNLFLNLVEIQENVDILLEQNLLESTLNVIEIYVNSEQMVQKNLQMYERISSFGESYRQKVRLVCLGKFKELSNPSSQLNPEVLKLIKETLIVVDRAQVIKPQRMSFMYLINKEARDYLLKGVICKLVKENGTTSELVVFLSPDFQLLQCKRPKDKITKQKWRMKITTIEEIFSDYQENKLLWTQSAFQKSLGLFKKKPDPARCFSVKGKAVPTRQQDLVQISFNVYAPTILDKNKMVEYLKVVIQQFTSKIL